MSKARKDAVSARETLKRLRSKLGLTQEEFAARIGVTVSTVNRWENGRSAPQRLSMRRIRELMVEAGLRRSSS